MAFSGQRFLITGGGSGIGQALAVKLAAEGANVSLLGRDRRKLDATIASLRPQAHEAWSIDLADAKQVATFAKDFIAKHASLNGLIHSAALFAHARVADIVQAEAVRLMEVNALVPLQLSSALLPSLRATKGDIVFVNSSAARGGAAGVATYAMTKSALRSLADSLRAEENAAGVRVLSVFPGRTATPMQEAVVKAEGGVLRAERLLQSADVADIVLAALRLPATAEVTELHVRPRLPPTVG